MGASEGNMVEARSDFVRITIGDAAFAATGGNYVPGLGPDSEKEWRVLRNDNRNDPDAVEAFLRKWDKLTDDRIQRIEDMRWMIEHQDVRGSEQYMRAHTPVPWKEG